MNSKNFWLKNITSIKLSTEAVFWGLLLKIKLYYYVQAVLLRKYSGREMLLHGGSEKTVSLICLVMDPTLETKKTPKLKQSFQLPTHIVSLKLGS